MKIDYSHYTNEQAMLSRLFVDTCYTECKQALDRAIEAHKAIVPLPHTNEQGNKVLNYANNTMRNICDHYLAIASVWRSQILACNDARYDELRAYAKANGINNSNW